MAGGLIIRVDTASPWLKLDTAAHVEHVEVVERDGNALELAGRRERRIPRHQRDLRIDMLVGRKIFIAAESIA